MEAHIAAHVDLIHDVIWPKLLFCSVGLLICRHVQACSLIETFILFEARRALWAPRSVGPYGLGRAPSPLMHAPVGHAYGCPAGAPIIGRDFFFFFVVARPLAFGSFPAPVMHP